MMKFIKFRSHKHFQQSNRIQNPYTITSSFSVHQQQTGWEENKKNNPIQSNLKKIKYLGINLTK
jgi:hypothetical protein